MTEVCSLRDCGEREARDVRCTRPGPWGNPYTVERYGWRALDLYRTYIRKLAVDELAGLFPRTSPLASLAGARLLCACPSEGVACHAWLLAEVVEMVTGVPVKPAPGRERCGHHARFAAASGCPV